MTLTNFDSSLLTLKRQRKALFSWKRSNDSYVVNGTSVIMEQPTLQSNGVVVARKLGAVTCGCDPAKDDSQTYDFNGLSQGNQVQ
jgi:hypothetical protein